MKMKKQLRIIPKLFFLLLSIREIAVEEGNYLPLV